MSNKYTAVEYQPKMWKGLVNDEVVFYGLIGDEKMALLQILARVPDLEKMTYVNIEPLKGPKQ